MLDAYETRGTQADIVETFVRFVGGTNAVTKVEGVGVTVTYVSTGIVTLTWAENPGRFIGLAPGFQATTVSEVYGYTGHHGVFNTTAFTLSFHIANASNAVANLTATQWANLRVSFARNGA